jgi:hypothetical protein
MDGCVMDVSKYVTNLSVGLVLVAIVADLLGSRNVGHYTNMAAMACGLSIIYFGTLTALVTLKESKDNKR